MKEQLLIDIIQHYPFLYDNSANDYKDNNKKSIAWDAIASGMASTVNKIQRIWKLLREKYAKERRVVRCTPSGSEARESSWPFYRAMGFMEKRIATRKYLNCVNYRDSGCRASGKIDVEFEVINGHHNHPRSENNIRTRHFKRQLREASIGERGSLKNIYERIAIRNPEAAVLIPYNSVRSSMLRWRQTTTPNIPANLVELAEILQTGSVVSDGHRAIIFGNQDFIRNFTESQYAFLDGTFKAVPRRPGFSEILTVFATSMDHAFPVVHVFMERRTRNLYDAVFGYLSRTFPNFVNGTIITDFEVSLVESLRASYPQASLKGCFFHFCQAVLRKAKMLGIVGQIEGNANGRVLLRKYYALALLPPEMIIPAFESLQGDNEELDNVFRGLHDYVRRQWLERVNPEHFSVFKQRHRTNNVMESYHRRLNSKLVRHPGIWNLIETLIDIQNTASIELVQLERTGRVFRVARKNVLFNARLDEAWNKLEDGRFNWVDFLRQAAHFVEGLDRQLHQWNEADGHDEDPVPAPLHADPMFQNPPQLQPLPEHPPGHVARPIPNEPPPPLHFFQPQPHVALPGHPLPPPELHEDPPMFQNPPQLQPLPEHPPGHVARPILNEAPPLHSFQPQPALAGHPLPPPELHEDHPVPDVFPRVDTPPLIFLHAEPPVPFAERTTPPPDLPVHPLPHPPSPPPNFPPSPNRFPNTTSPHLSWSPVSIQSLSPERPPSVPSPPPIFNFPPIPDEVGRLFAALDDEDDVPFGNIFRRRWESTIPATEYDEDSMSPHVRCQVCYLNMVQYIMTCGHLFCVTCSETLFNVQLAKCPMCRAALNKAPRPVYF